MIPESSNFFASLRATGARRRVAELFEPPTWAVRECGWAEYEVSSLFANLVIEAESPILMHGSVDEPEANADRILSTLRTAEIGYTAECYDSDGKLLRVWVWEVA